MKSTNPNQKSALSNIEKSDKKWDELDTSLDTVEGTIDKVKELVEDSKNELEINQKLTAILGAYLKISSQLKEASTELSISTAQAESDSAMLNRTTAPLISSLQLQHHSSAIQNKDYTAEDDEELGESDDHVADDSAAPNDDPMVKKMVEVYASIEKQMPPETEVLPIIQDQLGNILTQYLEKAKQLESAETELEQTKQQLKWARDDKQLIFTQLAKAKDDLRKEAEELQEEKEQFDKESAAARLRVINAQTGKEEATAKAANLKLENAQLSLQLEALEDRIKILNVQILNKDAHIEQLQSNASSKQVLEHDLPKIPAISSGLVKTTPTLNSVFPPPDWKSDRIEKLTEELEQAKSANESATEQLEEAKSANESTAKQLEEATKRNEEYAQLNTELSAKVSELELSAKDGESRYSKLLEAFKETQELNVKLLNEKASLRFEAKELKESEEQVKKMEEMLSAQEKTISDQSQSLEDVMSSLNSAISDLEKASQEKSSYAEKSEERYAELNKQFQEHVITAKQEIEKLREDNDEIERLRKASEAIMNALHQEREVAQRSNLKLEEADERSELMTAFWSGLKGQYDALIKQAKTECANLKNQIKEQETSIIENNRLHAEQEEKIAKLTSEKEATLAQMYTDTDHKAAELNVLRVQQEQKDEELKKAKTELRLIKAHVEVQYKALENLELQYEEEWGKIPLFEAIYEAKLKNKDEELKHSLEELEGKEDILYSVSDHNTKLKYKVADLEAHKAENAQKDDELQKLRAQISEQEQERESVKNQMAEAQAAHEKAIKEMQQEKETAEKKLATFSRDLTTKENISSLLSTSLKASEEQITALTRDKEKVEGELATMTANGSQKQEALNQLEQEKAKIEQKLKEESEQRSRLQSMNDTTKVELQNACRELKRLQKKRNELATKLQQSTLDAQANQSSMAALQAELAQVRQPEKRSVSVGTETAIPSANISRFSTKSIGSGRDGSGSGNGGGGGGDSSSSSSISARSIKEEVKKYLRDYRLDNNKLDEGAVTKGLIAIIRNHFPAFNSIYNPVYTTQDRNNLFPIVIEVYKGIQEYQKEQFKEVVGIPEQKEAQLQKIKDLLSIKIMQKTLSKAEVKSLPKSFGELLSASGSGVARAARDVLYSVCIKELVSFIILPAVATPAPVLGVALSAVGILFLARGVVKAAIAAKKAFSPDQTKCKTEFTQFTSKLLESWQDPSTLPDFAKSLSAAGEHILKNVPKAEIKQTIVDQCNLLSTPGPNGEQFRQTIAKTVQGGPTLLERSYNTLFGSNIGEKSIQTSIRKR